MQQSQELGVRKLFKTNNTYDVVILKKGCIIWPQYATSKCSI